MMLQKGDRVQYRLGEFGTVHAINESNWTAFIYIDGERHYQVITMHDLRKVTNEEVQRDRPDSIGEGVRKTA